MLHVLFRVIIRSADCRKGRILKVKTTIMNFLRKYSHAWVLLYAFIYVPWFAYLERHVTEDYHLIQSSLDRYIPFIEHFIVPYLLWFAFIAAVIIYFFFTDKAGFYRLTIFLFTGMTIFLIICTFYPNGQHLRPETFARDNLFVDLVKMLYKTDTPTNVLPSIHVFNSLGAVIAVSHSTALKKHRSVQIGAYLLAALIILSTVFLKQHSVIDMIAAFCMAGILYPFVYAGQPKKVTGTAHQTV